VDQLEQGIYQFVRRFPFSKPEFVEDRIVNKHKLMTKTEFSGAMRRLVQRGDLYEPRPGFVSVTFGRRPTRRFDEGGQVVKAKAIKIKVKDSKQKVSKSHVKLIRRKYVQGYKCRKCGKWVRRSWALRRLQKCPKCKTTKYYGKPVLLKVTKLSQRPTKLYRILIRYVEPSRVGRPGVTVARWKPPELTSEETSGLWMQFKRGLKRKHMKREEYRGSVVASAAAIKSWETRRRQGWKGKGELRRELSMLRRRAREEPLEPLNMEAVKAVLAAAKSLATKRGSTIVGFYKDEQGTTRPITKPLSELRRQRIIKKPKEFIPIKPKRLQIPA
jgi:predicted Zn-ribbon and HTH transcriptional regulator